MRISIICFIIYFTFLGCQKSEIDNEYKEEYVYTPNKIYSKTPVDLDFNNTKNNNLILELDFLKNSRLIINSKHQYVNIIWFEPSINNILINELNYETLPMDNLKYLSVQNIYYFKMKDIYIYPFQNAETTNYNFRMPEQILKNKDKSLSFKTSMDVMTPQGLKSIEIECNYILQNSM